MGIHLHICKRALKQSFERREVLFVGRARVLPIEDDCMWRHGSVDERLQHGLRREEEGRLEFRHAQSPAEFKNGRLFPGFAGKLVHQVADDPDVQP